MCSVLRKLNMAGNKKPKKKYVPKKIYNPNILNQMNSFSAFEEALSRFLKTGETEVDEAGVFIYKTNSGLVQAFESTLRVYIQLIEIFCMRKKTSFDTRPLSILQNRMFERKGFDEEEIENAQLAISNCKTILSRMNPLEVRDILQVIKTTLAWDKQQEESTLKDPKTTLARLERLAGKLSYEEVVSRNHEYQELANNNPNNQHIKELRDTYVKYLAAYNFCKRDEALKKQLV